MKLLWVLSIAFLLFQDGPPFKSNDEFELKLDLQFKQRPKEFHSPKNFLSKVVNLKECK